MTSDIDNTPSMPFKGYDWSEHKNVTMLVDAMFDEYRAWYKDSGENKRIRGAENIKQHLTHFVLEAYRTYHTFRKEKLDRLGLLAIGRDFQADLCLASIRFYSDEQ